MLSMVKEQNSVRCILVIDDDETFAESMDTLLSSEGYTVQTAGNSKLAKRRLETFSAQVALIDLRLGADSGLKLISEIKDISWSIVCVMVTAYASTESAVQALQSGAYDYLRKPFHVAELLKTLDRCFERFDLEQEKMTAEKELRASETRYRALYDDMPSMFFTLDRNGMILSVNHFGATQLGFSIDELIGKPISITDPEGEKSSVFQHIELCLIEPGSVQRWETAKLKKDGSHIWVRQTARLVTGQDDKSTILCVCEDITGVRKLSEQLSYQACHDPITSLINRREFERRIGKLLVVAKSEQTEHALCYLDLDQFKVINDTCGHVAGDELLRQLSQVLQARVRKTDTLARLGGDEFGILMESCSLDKAREIANIFHKAVQDFHFLWENKRFDIGVSIGLVPINEFSDNITGILSAADTACYAAKDKGRNRIHEYRADDAELAIRYREMHWVSRIQTALDEQRFILRIQPIISLKNNHGAEQFSGKIQNGLKNACIAHYEVLISMLDEEGAMVPPGAFLPAAERYNIVEKIDAWVINATIDWLQRHPDHLQQLKLCSINLSGQSLGNHHILDLITEKIGGMGDCAKKICFEVTETATISNLSYATQFIKQIKSLGCSFALDDFGSGLSSFAYLKNLAVDYLKIDGLFVKGMVDDPIDFVMVKSIHQIGKVMKIKTVAEYVENKAIKDKVKEIGIDYAQGFGIARPMLLQDLE